MSRSCLASVILLASTTLACADDAPANPRGGEPWARPGVIKPAYPPEAVAKGLTGVITIDGVAAPDGRFDEINYTPDRPESAVFVDAVSKVAPLWSFWNAQGDDCSPVSVRFRTQIAFTIEDGAPRIVVTHPPVSNAVFLRPAAAPRPGAHFKPTKTVKTDYPEAMRRRHYTGKTYAAITVDREGNVTSVKARTWPHPVTADVRVFDETAERNLAQWKFPAVPAGEKAPWTGCYEFSWRLRDWRNSSLEVAPPSFFMK